MDLGSSHSIRQLLQRYLERAGDGGRRAVTHTSIWGVTKGKYHLREQVADDFYLGYCDLLRYAHVSLNEVNMGMGLTELPHDILPVIVDIDLQEQVTDPYELELLQGNGSLKHRSRRLYTENQVKQVVEIYQRILRRYTINVTIHPVSLTCVVLEKPGYIVKKKDETHIFKNGFHLHFPAFWLTKSDMTFLLLPRVMYELDEKKVFTEPSSNVVDGSVTRNPWLLYGCHKEGGDTYMVTNVINEEGTSVSEDVFLKMPLTSRYPGQHKPLFDPSNETEYYWPMILSLHPWGRYHDFGWYTLDEDKITDFRKIGEYSALATAAGGKVSQGIGPQAEEPNEEKPDTNIREPDTRPYHANEYGCTTLGYESVLDQNDLGSSLDEGECGDMDGEPETNKNRLGIMSMPDVDYTFSHAPIIGANKTEEEINEIIKLLKILKKSRAEKYSDWLTIGMVLHAVMNGSLGGLQLWALFSKQCREKYNYDSLRKTYLTFKAQPQGQGYTVGTLHYFARTDGPEVYNQIVKGKQVSWLKDFLDYKSQNSLACLLYQRYGSQYRCAKLRNNIWYEYVDHHWRLDEEGVSMRKKITKDLKPLLFDMLRDSDDEKVSKMIYKVMGNVGNAGFKDQVMKEVREVFFEQGFKGKLDKNQYLFGFKNGVYDLKKHIFRCGIPDDYISIQTSVSYTHYAVGSSEMKEVEKFFREIFPDPVIYNYFLDVYSRIFVGNNAEKIFGIWTGSGDNGKSITTKLFEKMLGPYSKDLPTSLITQKRTASSSAMPELSRTEGARVCWLKEPSSDESVNCGILKELTGGDNFFARALYDEGHEISPMFKLVLVCNKPPKITTDQSAWNRIKVIPFETTFCENAPKCEKERIDKKLFPIDREFETKKLPLLSRTLPCFLLNHYKKTFRKPIIAPQKVCRYTSDYHNKNNYVTQFMCTYLKKDEESKCLLVTIFNKFRDWVAFGFPNEAVPKKMNINDLKEELQKTMGPPTSIGIFHGWKLVHQEGHGSEHTNTNDIGVTSSVHG